jgi:hypothetical protein
MKETSATATQMSRRSLKFVLITFAFLLAIGGVWVPEEVVSGWWSVVSEEGGVAAEMSELEIRFDPADIQATISRCCLFLWAH